MPVINLKPSHKIITHFYRAVADSGQMGLLRARAAPLGWALWEQGMQTGYQGRR
ncbi:MAG: hypothetical protein KA170_02505 [Candidatus Promineofilum sp.]|nr:hypothetical protein [Promineifilum sp.]